MCQSLIIVPSPAIMRAHSSTVPSLTLPTSVASPWLLHLTRSSSEWKNRGRLWRVNVFVDTVLGFVLPYLWCSSKPIYPFRGWTEAMQLMTEGAKWELYIPSELGYGDRGAGGSIPGGAVLIFTLELLKVRLLGIWKERDGGGGWSICFLLSEYDSDVSFSCWSINPKVKGDFVTKESWVIFYNYRSHVLDEAANTWEDTSTLTPRWRNKWRNIVFTLFFNGRRGLRLNISSRCLILDVI